MNLSIKRKSNPWKPFLYSFGKTFDLSGVLKNSIDDQDDLDVESIEKAIHKRMKDIDRRLISSKKTKQEIRPVIIKFHTGPKKEDGNGKRKLLFSFRNLPGKNMKNIAEILVKRDKIRITSIKKTLPQSVPDSGKQSKMKKAPSL